MATWVWDFADPFRWLVYTSFNNGVTWTLLEDYWTAGNGRLFAPDGGQHLILIVGVDDEGVEVTERSNAVRPDDGKMAAPVLVATWPSMGTWSWADEDPYRWNVYTSMDDGLTWTLIEDYWVAGTARDFSPDSGDHLIFIVGVDMVGHEITEHSNAVRPDDAHTPAPNPWLNGLADDLAAYWKLDEAEGTTRADSSGWANDLNEFGPWSEDPPTVVTVPGKFGNAVIGNLDTGFCLVNTTIGSFIGGDFTIAGWVKFSTEGYDGQIIFCIGAGMMASFRTFDYALNFYLATDDEVGYASITTADNVVTAGEWGHLVCVKTDTAIKIYYNGVLVATGELFGAAVESAAGYFNASDFILNMSPWGYPSVGGTDEVGVWLRALSEEQIGQLYNNGDGLAFEL